jgi:hypothetical protein
MSDSPSSMAPPPEPAEVSLETLAQAHQSLRTTLHLVMVMLVILTGSLFVFFLRELSLARRQIRDLTQVVAEYEKNAVPVMEDFRAKLQGFSRSHPDFVPIFTKYFGATNIAPLGPAQGRAQPLTTNSASSPARMPASR